MYVYALVELVDVALVRLGVHFKRFRGMFRHSSSIPLQHGFWGICLLPT